MEKVLTISIAAYNVQDFIEHTLDSLNIGKSSDLEVIVVNDGSKDDTLKLAKSYEEKYPNIFKVIDKENGGYGSTINTGIELATGKYFKQLDGDDWYDTGSLKKVIEALKNIDEDIVYTPYILYYEKDGSQKVEHNEIEKHADNTSIEELIINANPYLPMHSLMFKTKILKDNNVKILEHCFYTDVEYAVYPFLYSKTLRVLDIPLYVYRIGREGQSVSVEGRIKHYQDHLRVDDKMLELLKSDIKLEKNIHSYLKDYFASIFASCMSNYLLILKPTKEIFQLIKDYDKKILETDKEVYEKMGNKSGSVRSLRKAGFFKYKLLHCIKILKEKM